MLRVDAMNQLAEKTACAYRLLDGDIHELRFNEATRQTVDDLYDIIIEVLQPYLPDKPIRYLVVSHRINEPPIPYLTSRMRQIHQLYPKRPPVHVAILTRGGPMISLINMITRPFQTPTTHIKIFRREEYDDALNWLLES